IRAVFEIEFILAALLGRAGGGVAVLDGVAENGRAELLVHEDARLVLGHAGSYGGLESVVNHLLGGSELGRLFPCHSALPAKHLRLEGAAMIERQNVQRLVETDGHDSVSLRVKTSQARRLAHGVMVPVQPNAGLHPARAESRL